MDDRDAVIETTSRLFIATDDKDWEAVRRILADEVLFDMSSLGAGPAARLTGAAIAEAWRIGLADVAAIHHQAGNHLVTLRGDRAEVFCYGTATHYRPDAEKRVTTFVGSYDFGLVRAGDGWRIDAFRFNKKYVE